MAHVLIVDDDADAAEMLARLVADAGNTVATVGSLRDARRQLSLKEPDLVLLDLVLPDGSGIELYDSGLAANSEVVLITGHATLETSIQALRLGAADYLQKPINFAHLQGILSRVMRPAALKAEIEELNTEVAESGKFGLMWGRSAQMRRVYEQIARVAGTAVTVLVIGESGTGKEVAAQTIHELSRRRKHPFLAVNCGAISPHLIESEIFGHEKGSFTGAVRQHEGFFERAHGGTLFLDEITEMPLDLQVKLLRVLETGLFMRVGSTIAQETDVRVVAATNRDPERAVASGKLREDLLYRLNVFPILLPPLRERMEDVSLLAQHFLNEICASEGEKKTLSGAAMARLQAHRWPGNVRELRNAVHRAYVMASSPVITDEWLSFDKPASVEASGPAINIRIGTALADVERTLILATLKHFDNHRERTAAALGVSLKTLYNRLKEYSADGHSGNDAA
jgi:DNA-binding NtrC family response regulator